MEIAQRVMGEHEVLIEVEDLAQRFDRFLEPAELVADRRIQEVRGRIAALGRDAAPAGSERFFEPALVGVAPGHHQRVLTV